MRNVLALAGAALAAVVATASISAATPGQVPFPSPTVTGVFVAAETLNSAGVQASQFAPGSTVLMRAYAVDVKTHKALVGTDVKYFYATIPGQPNVKFAYDPKASGATARLPWTATWTVPAMLPAPRVVPEPVPFAEMLATEPLTWTLAVPE